ncbi:hypothetical protein FOPE_12723 [Fonsecaea pedrosoi]|nr:hypothetical protein FOPE_12723 [Fonsecaea pedrosoi]
MSQGLWTRRRRRFQSLMRKMVRLDMLEHRHSLTVSEKLNQSQELSKAHSNTADSLSSKAKISAKSREWDLEG